MALFVPYLERRLGVVPTLILLIACGALGALAAPGLDDALGDGFTLMAGGNGIALGAVGAWWCLHRADARDDPTEEYDWIPVAVAAVRAPAPAPGRGLRQSVGGGRRRPGRAGVRVLGHARRRCA